MDDPADTDPLEEILRTLDELPLELQYEAALFLHSTVLGVMDTDLIIGWRTELQKQGVAGRLSPEVLDELLRLIDGHLQLRQLGLMDGDGQPDKAHA